MALSVAMILIAFGPRALAGELRAPVSGPLPGQKAPGVTTSSAVRSTAPPPATRDAATSTPVNPHWRETLCQTCHPKQPSSGVDGKRLLESSPRDNCNRCHPPNRMASMSHPYDVKASSMVRVPSEWPLDNGLVGCLTCHDILKQCLGKLTDRWRNRAFLRRAEKETPLEFCLRCHPRERYQTQSPHDQVDEKGRAKDHVCLYCHVARPDPAKPETPDWAALKAVQAELCGNCHGTFPHPIGIPHLVAVKDEMIARMLAYEVKDQYVIPVEQIERYVEKAGRLPRYLPIDPRTYENRCTTCHNPHEVGVLPAYWPLARGAEGKLPTNYRLRLPKEEICSCCHRM